MNQKKELCWDFVWDDEIQVLWAHGQEVCFLFNLAGSGLGGNGCELMVTAYTGSSSANHKTIVHLQDPDRPSNLKLESYRLDTLIHQRPDLTEGLVSSLPGAIAEILRLYNLSSHEVVALRASVARRISPHVIHRQEKTS